MNIFWCSQIRRPGKSEGINWLSHNGWPKKQKIDSVLLVGHIFGILGGENWFFKVSTCPGSGQMTPGWTRWTDNKPWVKDTVQWEKKTYTIHTVDEWNIMDQRIMGGERKDRRNGMRKWSVWDQTVISLVPDSGLIGIKQCSPWALIVSCLPGIRQDIPWEQEKGEKVERIDCLNHAVRKKWCNDESMAFWLDGLMKNE
jgi:hypothetical protein